MVEIGVGETLYYVLLSIHSYNILPLKFKEKEKDIDHYNDDFEY